MIASVRHSPATGLSKDDALTPQQRELREAAQGFEAIMIRRMLEAARASSLSEDTPLTGGGLKQFEQMRDEHFADIAAQSGTFGFALSIEAQLAQFIDDSEEV